MRLLYVTATGGDFPRLQQALAQERVAFDLDRIGDVSGVVSRVSADRYDGIIVDDDVSMETAAALIVEVRRRVPHLKIVCLSSGDAPAETGKAMLAGADECLPKSEAGLARVGPALLNAGARAREGGAPPARVLYAGPDRDFATCLGKDLRLPIEPVSWPTDGPLAPSTAHDLDAADVLLFDGRGEGPERVAAFKELQAHAPKLPLLVVADDATHATYLRLGAHACVSPSAAADCVSALVERGAAARQLALENSMLRAREARLRLLVEQIPHSVLLAGPDGGLLALNRAGLRLLGTQHARQVVGTSLLALATPSSAAELEALLATVSAGEPRTSTIEVTGLDGVTRLLELTAVPFRREPDRQAAVLATFRESTAVPAVSAPDEWDEVPLPADHDEAVTELARQLEAAHAARAAAEQALEALQQERDSAGAGWQQRLEMLEQAAAASAGDREELEAALAVAREQAARRQEELEAARQTLAAAQAALEAERSARERGEAGGHDRALQLEDALRLAAEREAQDAIDGAVRLVRLKQLEEQNAELSRRLLAAQGDVTEREAAWQQARTALELRIEELSVRDNDAANQLGLLRARLDEAEAELAGSRAERDEADRAREAAQGRAADAERLVETLRAEVGHEEAGVRTLVEQTRRLEAELREAEAGLQDVERSIEERDRRLEQVTCEGSELRTQLDSAHAHVRQLQAEVAGLEQRVLDAAHERRDLLARLEAAQETRQGGDEKFAWLFEFDELGSMRTSHDGVVLSLNDMAARLCGYASPVDVVSERTEVSRFLASALRAATDRGAGPNAPRRFEICVQRPDGFLYWLLGVGHTEEDATEWLLLDISDRRLQSRRSRYLRRMDALAHFLSSATTECSGLMGEVGESLNALVAGTATSDNRHQWLHSQRAVTRTGSVLRQLGGFARKRNARPIVLDVNGALDKASVLLSRLSGDEVPCDIRVGDEPLWVSVDSGELEQMLTNTVIAARDCLIAGGQITVNASREESETVEDRLPTIRAEAVIGIEAAGYGATEGVVSPKLVDLVSRLGGQLDVKHEPEARTTFCVSLPLVHRMATADPPPSEGQAVDQPPRRVHDA
jgi:PAS domain S-box-containing protein